MRAALHRAWWALGGLDFMPTGLGEGLLGTVTGGQYGERRAMQCRRAAQLASWGKDIFLQWLPPRV